MMAVLRKADVTPRIRSDRDVFELDFILNESSDAKNTIPLNAPPSTVG
jgi:hypothetical protein